MSNGDHSTNGVTLPRGSLPGKVDTLVKCRGAPVVVHPLLAPVPPSANIAKLPTVTTTCIFIGDPEVGKTSLWLSIRQGCKGIGEVPHVETTGADYFHIHTQLCDLPQLATLKTTFYDTAGQERFHSLTGAYVRTAKIIFLVFDLTAEVTLRNIESNWIKICRQHSTDPHYMVIGNKADKTDKRFATRSEIMARLARILGVIGADDYFEVSALNGEGVVDFVRTALLHFTEHSDICAAVRRGDLTLLERNRQTNGVLRLQLPEAPAGSGYTGYRANYAGAVPASSSQASRKTSTASGYGCAC